MYYFIKLKSLPKVFMAHRYSSDKYDFSFGCMKNTVEISYNESGNAVHEYANGEKVDYLPGMITVNGYAQPMRVYGKNGNSHVTIGFSFDDGDIAVLKDDCAPQGITGSEMTAVLPSYANAGDIPQVRELLYKTVTAHTTGNELLCSAYAMQILAIITQTAMEKLGSVSPAGELYIKKAKEYIAQNLHRQISVHEIAQKLGISYGYFSVLFKSAMGQSTVSYINRKKMERVAELMREKNISLSAAGEQVGIVDENYLSRLFKSCMGMSAHEYKLSLAQRISL